MSSKLDLLGIDKKPIQKVKYIILPLRRGFSAIKMLFDLCEKHNSVICGGYARYCASPKSIEKVLPAHDVDIYSRTKESVDALVIDIEALGFEIVHENSLSISFKPKEDKKVELQTIPIPQIIKPIVREGFNTTGTIEDILDNFDFTVTCAAILNSGEVLVDKYFVRDETRNHLIIKKIHCPISSLSRCCKYARKGYYIRPSESLKLFLDWSNRSIVYRTQVTELLKKSRLGGQSDENPDGLTQDEIDNLESLMTID